MTRKLLLLSTLLLCNACAMSPPTHPIARISMLAIGMSKEDVRGILGNPAKAEFTGNRDAWHYCRNGKSANEFAVVMFIDGKTTEAHNYNVPVTDPDNVREDCARYIKTTLLP